MAYLRAIRLELARSELAHAGRKGGSVTGVANTCGIGHLSRFADDYQARFGESPSQTLRRGSIGRPRRYSVALWRYDVPFSEREGRDHGRA
jgi:transcriptional regulator GlxA family with amidase domain